MHVCSHFVAQDALAQTAGCLGGAFAATMVSSIARDLLEVLESDAAALLTECWREWLTNMYERLVLLEGSEASAVPSKRARMEQTSAGDSHCDPGLQGTSETVEFTAWVLTYEEGGQSRETAVRCAGAFGTKGEALKHSTGVIRHNCSWMESWPESGGCDEYKDNKRKQSERS